VFFSSHLLFFFGHATRAAVVMGLLWGGEGDVRCFALAPA